MKRTAIGHSIIALAFVISLATPALAVDKARQSVNRSPKSSAPKSSSKTPSRDSNKNVSKNVNVNQNKNVNRNTNVNVDRDVDVDIDVDHDHHGGYYGGGCCYHDDFDPLETMATIALTAVVIGSVVNTIPPSCTVVVVNGLTYQQCGSSWYQPQFSGTSTTYVVVNPPR